MDSEVPIPVYHMAFSDGLSSRPQLILISLGPFECLCRSARVMVQVGPFVEVLLFCIYTVIASI